MIYYMPWWVTAAVSNLSTLAARPGLAQGGGASGRCTHSCITPLVWAVNMCTLHSSEWRALAPLMWCSTCTSGWRLSGDKRPPPSQPIATCTSGASCTCLPITHMDLFRTGRSQWAATWGLGSPSVKEGSKQRKAFFSWGAEEKFGSKTSAGWGKLVLRNLFALWLLSGSS